jgi:hypothetical protein
VIARLRSLILGLVLGVSPALALASPVGRSPAYDATGESGTIFTVPVQFSDGTVAAPGLVFATDTDTGWFNSTVNTGRWHFSQNGTAVAGVGAFGGGNVGFLTDGQYLVANAMSRGSSGSDLAMLRSTGLHLANTLYTAWYSGGALNSAADTSWYRAAAGIVAPGTGANSGNGNIRLNGGVLTVGTMTATNTGELRCVRHRYDWTNAMVAALAGTAGDIPIATLPAKTIVKDVLIEITGAAVGPTTVTVSAGRTGASYIDYVVASNAKAAANTIYGDAINGSETGTNLFDATTKFVTDLPSWTGTTVLNAHFVSTGANLSTTTGSTGAIHLTTCFPQ